MQLCNLQNEEYLTTLHLEIQIHIKKYYKKIKNKHIYISIYTYIYLSIYQSKELIKKYDYSRKYKTYKKLIHC